MTQFDFTLSEDLKQRMVQKISYDPTDRVITIKYKSKSIRVFTYPEYLEKTIKIFDEQVNGIPMKTHLVEYEKKYGGPLTDLW